jgi:hypothetical protein
MCNLKSRSVGLGRPTQTILLLFFYFVSFLIFFSRSRTGRTERRTNKHDGSNNAVVPFWGLVDVRIEAYKSEEYPQTPKISQIGHFQSKSENVESLLNEEI